MIKKNNKNLKKIMMNSKSNLVCPKKQLRHPGGMSLINKHTFCSAELKIDEGSINESHLGLKLGQVLSSESEEKEGG